jgi:hypothetical protein
MRFAKLSSPTLLALGMMVGCSSSTPGGIQQKADLAGFGSSGDMAGDSGTGPGPVLDFAGDDLTGVDLAHAGGDMAIVAGSNTVPLIVDGYEQVPDVGYISVTICLPGTTTCQTIDHIDVDTGSVGLRIISTALNASMLSGLPNLKVGTKSTAECYVYGDGYVYGTLRTADVSIGGEKSPGTSVHILGDITGAPSKCTQSGSNESTASAFGSNGIIGLHPITPDCGSTCASASGQENPFYYSCSSATSCTTAVGVPVANQVPNIVTTFPTDNNGVILELPTVAAAGAASSTGTLTFGIGTQSNNALGSATKYPATLLDGELQVLTGEIKTTSYQATIFDSGTSTLSFNLSGLTACSGQEADWYCDTTTESVTLNSTASALTINIGDADTLLSSNNNAFDNLATDGEDGYLILGLPAFFGRKLFFGINGTAAYYAF